MKFGINFTSCSEDGNEIARGIAECYFAVIATTSGEKTKLSKSSSRRFDDSMATVRVLRSDQSARYSTFFTLSSEKGGIAS